MSKATPTSEAGGMAERSKRNSRSIKHANQEAKGITTHSMSNNVMGPARRRLAGDLEANLKAKAGDLEGGT